MLEGYNVRKLGEQPYQMPQDRISGPPSGAEPAEADDEEEDPKEDRPLIERIKGMFSRK